MDDSLIRTGNVNLSSVGLTVTNSLSYEEWIDLMRTLVRLETAFQFAIGDALIYGESQYGEKYSQAMDATGLSYQSLANMVWVAKHVPMHNRVQDVSWTHHRVVASVEQSDQKAMLEWARDKQMSAADLHNHVSGKPPKKREHIALPPGVSEREAEAVLERYVEAIRIARSGSEDPDWTPDQELVKTCILCKDCPYRTRSGEQA